MYEKFYRRFKIVTRWPFWQDYLLNSYSRCIDDLKHFQYLPDFEKQGFTAVLCGTSGEITSAVFSQFILNKNEKATIIIFDLGDQQIYQSRKILSEKFPHAKICCLRADARKMPFAEGSLDYIETDILFNFMDTTDMATVIGEWKYTLAEDGFITTRVLASNNRFLRAYDAFLLKLGNHVMGVQYRTHSIHSVAENIQKTKLLFINGGKLGPFRLNRFSIIKARAR